jgi:phosphopantothenoylcysteine synthetase/decarboxylase
MSAEEPRVSRDYDPTPGQWYEDLDRDETFKVLAVDPDDSIVRVQWLDREVEEMDLDAWNELDLDLAEEPEGWADDSDDDDDDDEDDDWEDDEDFDDDEDDDEDDDDYDDDDDEYRDRE